MQCMMNYQPQNRKKEINNLNFVELLFERGTPFLKGLFLTYPQIRKLGSSTFSSYNKATGKQGGVYRLCG